MTLNELLVLAGIIKAETGVEKNTHTRIGQMFLDIINYFQQNGGAGGSGDVTFDPTSTAPVYEVGQSAFGGTIGYILQPGDYGYDAAFQKGIIVAEADLDDAKWSADRLNDIATTGEMGDNSKFGDGLLNTDLIVNALGAGAYAAKLCYDLELNGFSDWYLPVMEEIFAVRAAAPTLMNSSLGYWISSQASDSRLAYVTMAGGAEGDWKDSIHKVRPFRNFSEPAPTPIRDGEIVVFSDTDGKKITGSGKTIAELGGGTGTGDMLASEYAGPGATKSVRTADYAAGVKAGSALDTALAGKVDKNGTDRLMTQSEGDKLAGINEHWRGTFISLEALKAAIPVGVSGNKATIDGGIGTQPQEAIWDVSDEDWFIGSGIPITVDQSINEGSINAVSGGSVFSALLGKLSATKAAIESLLTGLITSHWHSTYVDCTLVRANWIPGTLRQTINVAGVLTASKIFIYPNTERNNYLEYAACQISAVEKTDGTVTFETSLIPDSDLSLTIEIR
ncbi:MAG TPA: hypothetical protein VI413_10785 [Paludibacter sp.]